MNKQKKQLLRNPNTQIHQPTFEDQSPDFTKHNRIFNNNKKKRDRKEPNEGENQIEQDRGQGEERSSNCQKAVV